MTSDLQIPFPTQPGLGLPFRWRRKGNLDQGTRKLDRRHTSGNSVWHGSPTFSCTLILAQL